MKKRIECRTQSAFTLIELVLVVAVIAILTAIAIGKFADIRKDSARKANVNNIKSITRTINTKLAMEDGEDHEGMFAYAEALIDCNPGGGAPSGSEGTYTWAPTAGWYDGEGGTVPGIYCGIKRTDAGTNAEGYGNGVIPAIQDAHKSNRGLSTFSSSLGLYYLVAGEVTQLNKVGVSIVSYHNYANVQSATLGWSGSIWETQYGLHSAGGGPGQRADLSACYPVVLTNGMAVAVINPVKGASIYRDLGCTYGSTNGVSGVSASNPETYFAKGICKRLIVVGMGRDTEINTKLFENSPRCMTLDKTYYRNYLLVFEMNNRGGNSSYICRFAGVLDPEGNTAKQAQYAADWNP